MTTPPLDELDADARAMLDAFMAEEQPPARVRGRVWQRVEADVAAPPGRGPARVVVLAVAAAVALMWVGRQALSTAVEVSTPASQAGYERAGARPGGVAEPLRGDRTSPRAGDRAAAADDADTVEPEPSALRDPATDSAVLEPRDPAADPASSEPSSPATTPTTDRAPTSSPVTTPTTDRDPMSSRPKVDPRRPAGADRPAAPEPVAPAPAPGGTLAEENRLLSQARAALIDEHPEQALLRLDEHAQRFPTGVLVQERQALRAVALCEAGRQIEGSAAARSFLRAHPRAALAQRVRSACLEP